ncbi:MAG: hypothetical protein P8R37_07865 [Opitutae bacterium]|nr:hypothetical protein [Opitutae bacterium]MDG1301491.1 hypothetical protein [Opitutae bacterium]
MPCKILTLLSLVAAALVFTGCDGRKAQMTSGETNVLGLYKNVQESYAPSSPNSFTINTNELYTRKNFSGDKTTLFWGLITIKDY